MEDVIPVAVDNRIRLWTTDEIQQNDAHACVLLAGGFKTRNYTRVDFSVMYTYSRKGYDDKTMVTQLKHV